MFIFENGKMARKENISISNKNKQIIFTSPKNETLLNWLHSKDLPEQFFEDISNEDQSVGYEDWGEIKLITINTKRNVTNIFIFLIEKKAEE